ncbi:hypothetical protein M3B38_01810 [Dietzia cinnamea]|uniref:HNH endonuclease n=1 Tax=Dietzia cinnamea TaxID=321318 RepID=UPI0021A956CC|nr:hypothetical protein [Dietzia cinnamea]MCT1710723.1 hypothetical protein [Dietzia cinnamea]
MAWLRVGDEAATYPAFLRVDEHPDWEEGLTNEMFGFLARCATQAAAHYTDYVVSLGTARLIAGSPARAATLIQIAVDCELMTPIDIDGRRQWKLLDDEKFMHMRSKEEVDRDNQRKRDLSDHDLVMPVRIRDGDQCRYCRVVVNWGDQRGARGGTYDHRNGIDGQANPGNVVVCCRSCNRDRGDDPAADTRIPLLDPPALPYYKKRTADWINSSPWAKTHGTTVTASPSKPSGPTGRQRPASQAGHAPTTPTPSGPAHHGDSDPEPGIARDSDSDRPRGTAHHGDSDRDPGPARHTGDSDRDKTVPAAPTPSGNSERPTPPPTTPPLTNPDQSWPIQGTTKPGIPGSGRVGSGRAGSARGGKPIPPAQGDGRTESAPPPGRRSRGRRRKRKT